ncbi:MAG: phosphoribosylamine--glycine ligase [Candidatus Gracilibacteria bacterium]|nr:phosphoribosylamine--glycine ligase [bacterium]MDZ4216866.1 phosphoribosylamine--glycine ligase [Candidatus Gracilibacteria bacterium]
MKILLVGNGGREHAIAEALIRSSHKPDLYVFANKVNPGIKALSKRYYAGTDLSDFEELKHFVDEVRPDFAFVGPDNPIADGIVDLLESFGVPSVAPAQAPARLESSKYFTRELLEKHFIPGNPRFRQFDSEGGVMSFLQELGDDYVVKADGLAFGKGVKVSGDHLRNHEEALKFVRECLGGGQSSVVIEEKLYGVEFSLMAFADGRHLAFMPVVQDHKRAYEGDEGPNTGGMGSYSDVNHSMPFLTDQELDQAKQISQAVLLAVREETGQEFKGILYGGFMACRDGVKLIEYNARFGDPEAMNVLPILETDFVEVCQAVIKGTLDELEVRFAPKATVCLYVVPEGYPDDSMAHEPLEIGEMPDGVQLFYSSVNEEGGEIMTSGSRSLGIVGIGDSIEEARLRAVDGVDQVKGKIFYRKDIGSLDLLNKRIQMMEKLRAARL